MLHSDRSSYAAGEPIQMSASLVYEGPRKSVTVSGSRLNAGLRYTQLDGSLDIETGSATVCEARMELTGLEPVTTEFTPFIGFENEPSTIDWYRAWSQSDFLWLPEGTWLIQAFTDFHIGRDCGDERVMLTEARVLTITGTSP